MQLKTILNLLERYKSFVYGDPRWGETGGERCIDVPIEPRKNGRPDHPSGGARSGSCSTATWNGRPGGITGRRG